MAGMRTLEALPATRGGSALRGRSLVGAVLDEAAFFRDEDYSVNDAEIYRAVAPRILPEGQTIIASTPWAEGVGLLQQPTMTKVLDRMERDGLVKRQQDARDRRLVRVHLAQRGEAMVTDLLAAARAHEAEVVARHPDAGAIKDLLRALIARQSQKKRPRGA